MIQTVSWSGVGDHPFEEAYVVDIILKRDVEQKIKTVYKYVKNKLKMLLFALKFDFAGCFHPVEICLSSWVKESIRFNVEKPDR